MIEIIAIYGLSAFMFSFGYIVAKRDINRKDEFSLRQAVLNTKRYIKRQINARYLENKILTKNNNILISRVEALEKENKALKYARRCA